jgi:hypothetical protein
MQTMREIEMIENRRLVIYSLSRGEGELFRGEAPNKS